MLYNRTLFNGNTKIIRVKQVYRKLSKLKFTFDFFLGMQLLIINCNLYDFNYNIIEVKCSGNFVINSFKIQENETCVSKIIKNIQIRVRNFVKKILDK